MTPNFDIFRIETNGNVCWLKVAATFEDAKTLAHELSSRAPNGLIILDQKTGTRHIIEPPHPANASTQQQAQL